MNMEEQMLFKEEYSRRLKLSPIKTTLSPHEVENKDFWAVKIFKNASFAFMFPILIPNIKYAMENGYETVAMWEL